MTIYDPLLSQFIEPNLPPADSYWRSVTPTLNQSDDQPLATNIQADVAIIGGGYTGLSCAIELAQAGVKNIVVLEANEIGWGCSGRNAGFVLPGSGRLSYKQLADRFGKQATHVLHQQFLEGIERIKALGETYDIGQTQSGYLKLAHSRQWFDRLSRSADYLCNTFDYQVETIDQATFRQDYVDHHNVYGAIRYENGFGINPQKLIQAYYQKAKSLGVAIYPHSAVRHIARHDKQQQITTANGQVIADKLVMATNGYTPAKMQTALKGKTLPVLTSVIVTEPLTSQQLADANFITQQVMMDTRELKYYYRLLADNRVLFGGRGAIAGKDAQNPIYAQRLLNELHRSFPALKQLKMEFNWHGWISVSLDQMPHIYGIDDVFYATGYCGSGVSFTAMAGKQLADLVLGKVIDSPLNTPLPTFPFAPFRRIGQRLYYQIGRLKDAMG